MRFAIVSKIYFRSAQILDPKLTERYAHYGKIITKFENSKVLQILEPHECDSRKNDMNSLLKCLSITANANRKCVMIYLSGTFIYYFFRLLLWRVRWFLTFVNFLSYIYGKSGFFVQSWETWVSLIPDPYFPILGKKKSSLPSHRAFDYKKVLGFVPVDLFGQARSTYKRVRSFRTNPMCPMHHASFQHKFFTTPPSRLFPLPARNHLVPFFKFYYNPFPALHYGMQIPSKSLHFSVFLKFLQLPPFNARNPLPLHHSGKSLQTVKSPLSFLFRDTAHTHLVYFSSYSDGIPGGRGERGIRSLNVLDLVSFWISGDLPILAFSLAGLF